MKIFALILYLCSVIPFAIIVGLCLDDNKTDKKTCFAYFCIYLKFIADLMILIHLINTGVI